VVSIQANLFPHLSQRERAYLWPDPRDKDYIVLDVSDPSFWNRDGAQEQIESDLRHNRQFGWVVARDGYLVLKKGAPVRPLPDSFYSFARVTDPDIQYPMTIDFGDKVRFLGFTPIYEREEEVRYNLYFQALQPLGEDYGVVLYLADAQGNVVGGTDRTQPVPVWYPTSRWQPGETIQVTANTLNWWTGDRDEYAVALGLVKGNDIWDVGARLQPRVRASAWANPLLADGSVAQMMRFRRSWELHEPIEERRAFSPPPMAFRTEARFGGQADLAGYTLDRTRLQRGEPLALSLYWKAGSAPDRNVPYTVFVHVRDAAGNIVAQRDSMPGDGRLPATSWMPGEYVTDRHVIPLSGSLPPGPYEVALGLYRPDTGARLPVTGTPGLAQGDYVVLEQKIDVVE
jgi:hypothetical protein